jgi:hypothetical protein
MKHPDNACLLSLSLYDYTTISMIKIIRWPCYLEEGGDYQSYAHALVL